MSEDSKSPAWALHYYTTLWAAVQYYSAPTLPYYTLTHKANLCHTLPFVVGETAH